MSRIVLSDRRVLQSYPNSSSLEWLETNGTGAFALGTVAGANTKRTHAHLIAPDGQVLLSKFDEELRWNGHRAGLSSNQYPGARQPTGEEFLEQFRLDPFPIWRYRCEDIVVERSLFLAPGETAAVAEWRQLSGPKCWLEVRPFFARRSLAELQRSAPLPPALPALSHSAAKVFADGYWYFNFVYDTGQEDLYSPALYQFRLEPGQSAWMAVSAQDVVITEAQVELWRQKRMQRGGDRAEDFVLHASQIRTGYPRGTPAIEQELLALPGLLISRGRAEEARAILRRAWAHSKPSLWLFPALVAYQRKFGADAFLTECPSTLLDAWLAEADPTTGLVPGSCGTNALWINALLAHNALSGVPGPAQAARHAMAHYERHFWPGGQVRELDPEQLLAVSLPYLCLEAKLRRAIVDAVTLTQVANTWMLAHYLTAYLRVHDFAPSAIAQARKEVARVEAELLTGCLGHLPHETESASAVRLAEFLRAKALLGDS